MVIPMRGEAVPLNADPDGVVRVAHTRVSLDTLILAFVEGATAEEIAQQYPSLELADIYAVIAYYLRHRSDFELYLRKRQKEADVVRKENERRFAPQGIRSCLLARRRKEA